MYCKECGKEFENPNASFCIECGVSKGKGNNFCENCGAAKKSINQDVCLTCGTRFKGTFGKFKNNVNFNNGTSDKTKLVTLLLLIFVGGFGIHDFYLGNNARGAICLALSGVAVITCGYGIIGIGAFLILELVQLLTNKLTDGQGRPVTEWS